MNTLNVLVVNVSIWERTIGIYVTAGKRLLDEMFVRLIIYLSRTKFFISDVFEAEYFWASQHESFASWSFWYFDILTNENPTFDYEKI